MFFFKNKRLIKLNFFLILILTSTIAFCQLGDQSIFTAPKHKLNWDYALTMKLVGGMKDEGGFLIRQYWWQIPESRREAILSALKNAAEQGLAKLDCKIKKNFETLLYHPEKLEHTEIWIEYCYIQEYTSKGKPMAMGSDTELNIIKIYLAAWKYKNGECIDGLLLHELLHFAGYGEDVAYPCSHKVFPCAPLNPKYPEDCECKEPKKDGDELLPSPGGDNPDDNFSVASHNLSFKVYESSNPDLLILKQGYYKKSSALIDRFKRKFAYIEPDESPLEMREPPSILIIPTGGLYGMENSEQFKAILEEYVSNGGTVICFAQQHGYLQKIQNLKSKYYQAHSWKSKNENRKPVNSINSETGLVVF